MSEAAPVPEEWFEPRSALAFTTPNVGDDATDSDVELISENSYELTARSAEFVVPENGSVTIDVGVVPVS